eukprot:gnl/TRDRNA2_/TRDRNA2_141451_c0_seq1.p1 gnl/TRDRNA2_/TRDRNA2_141451_c0~~gnl/TRDRNA2_/TRDRNA2_141451_c0_seq1.p1  ORF type:complete len:184 (+),score=2.38 gnl/TRDRNA2_/TRDRNA2_141451_c0_seq1:171-722(+)
MQRDLPYVFSQLSRYTFWSEYSPSLFDVSVQISLLVHHRSRRIGTLPSSRPIAPSTSPGDHSQQDIDVISATRCKLPIFFCILCFLHLEQSQAALESSFYSCSGAAGTCSPPTFDQPGSALLLLVFLLILLHILRHVPMLLLRSKIPLSISPNHLHDGTQRIITAKRALVRARVKMAHPFAQV